jgi:hypothetical protein
VKSLSLDLVLLSVVPVKWQCHPPPPSTFFTLLLLLSLEANLMEAKPLEAPREALLDPLWEVLLEAKPLELLPPVLSPAQVPAIKHTAAADPPPRRLILLNGNPSLPSPAPFPTLIDDPNKFHLTSSVISQNYFLFLNF